MKKILKTLNLPSSSESISGVMGITEFLVEERDYFPDVIAGNGLNSILGVVIAMKNISLWEETKDFLFNLEIDNVYSTPPLTKKGNLTLKGIWNVVTKGSAFGTQEKFKGQVSSLITEFIFNKYKEEVYPDCFSGIVNLKTGRTEYINIKHLDYDMYLDIVSINSLVPTTNVFTHLRASHIIGADIHDYIPSHWIFKNIEGISENISIYARPKEVKTLFSDAKEINTLADSLDIRDRLVSLELSKFSKAKEDGMAKVFKIDNTQIFLPTFEGTIYNSTPSDRKTYYESGYHYLENGDVTQIYKNNN